jgi:hypothetical protein
MIDSVSPQGDQVVFEYLSRVSDAGMRVLTPERRLHLIAGLRRAIDEARRKERAESADAVRRLLKRFGDPIAIVDVAAGRPSSARPRTPRPPRPASTGSPSTVASPASALPRAPRMPTSATTPPEPTGPVTPAPPSPAGPAARSARGRVRQPQQPHPEGSPPRPAAVRGPGVVSPGSTPPPGPPLPPITKLRAFDPDKVRFWAKGQMNTGSRLDLLALFVLGVASLLLPILGFIGGAVMVHQTKAYKGQDELVAFAAIPTLGFVLAIALQWPNDPSFTETMTALADALARATALGGVVGAGYLWTRQGRRAPPGTTLVRRPSAFGQVGTPPQPGQRSPQPQLGQQSAPRQPGQQGAPRQPGRSGPLGQSGSRRQSGETGTLGQWFPPRPPR